MNFPLPVFAGYFPTVVPPGDAEKYDLYGYKLYPIKFNQGSVVKIPLKTQAIENLSRYIFLGFDVISRTGLNFFEHSPLSCNGGYDRFAVNAHCLIDRFEEAYKCWETIRHEIAGVELTQRPDGTLEWTGVWEPGPYYFFEVFRRKTN